MKTRSLLSLIIRSMTVGKKPPRLDMTTSRDRVIASRKARKKELTKILAARKAGLR